jgi:phosphoglycolate phosphatase
VSGVRGRVLLFDVDGTLLLAGGGGRRAMELAFDDVYGRPDALAGLDFRGLTDPVILRTGMARVRSRSNDDSLPALIDAYLMHLRRTVAHADAFQVLPGVRELLEQLRAYRHAATGLGTGNIEAGARIKLARAGLNHYFAFGGFGSDHADRAEVLRTGAARGAARLGTDLTACTVVVVGDTPRDVAAARAIGAQSVAVSTGGYAAEILATAGAETVLSSLADPRALTALVG